MDKTSGPEERRISSFCTSSVCICAIAFRASLSLGGKDDQNLDTNSNAVLYFHDFDMYNSQEPLF